jgi:quercetin dioxygenase-like cupin family protein
MKNSNFYRLVFLALTFMLVACGEQSKKTTQQTADEIQKPVEVEHKMIFENDYAKVLKVILAPGESIKQHQGDKRVIYSLTDYAIDWEEQGEKLGTKSWKKGQAHYHEAGEHAATNNGTTTAEWLVFVKKNADLPECADNQLENDVNSVSSDFATILLDNDEFRVTEVTLPINASIPMHSGVNRVIYSLTDYQIMYESNDEGKTEKTFKLGDIHWHEACQHGLQNIGQTEATFLVISYKRK